MVTGSRSTGTLLIAPLTIAGCSDAAGPSGVTVDGLRIEFTVAPSSIERQETLIASLRLDNLQDEPVEVVSSCTTLASLGP